MYNKRHRVTKLLDLDIGDKVWIIDMRAYGEIVSKDASPNSFIVKTERGNTVRRNCWHLIPTPYKNDLVVTDENLIVPDDTSANNAENVRESENVTSRVGANVNPALSSVQPSELRDNVQVEMHPENNEHVATPASDTSNGNSETLRRSVRQRKQPDRFNS